MDEDEDKTDREKDRAKDKETPKHTRTRAHAHRCTPRERVVETDSDEGCDGACMSERTGFIRLFVSDFRSCLACLFCHAGVFFVDTIFLLSVVHRLKIHFRFPASFT